MSQKRVDLNVSLEERAYRLIQRMIKESGGDKMPALHPITKVPRFIKFDHFSAMRPKLSKMELKAPGQALKRIIDLQFDRYVSKSLSKSLVVDRIIRNKGGSTSVSYKQFYKGLPVYNAWLTAHLDSKGRLSSINGYIVPDISVDLMHELDAKDAVQEASYYLALKHDLNILEIKTLKSPKLVIFNPAMVWTGKNENCLAWVLDIGHEINGNLHVAEQVVVNANTGKVMYHEDLLPDVMSREIYDAQNNPNFNMSGSQPVRTEGSSPSGDAEVDAAYDYLGDAFNFFDSKFGWDFGDEVGVNMRAIVRACWGSHCPTPNAKWDSNNKRIYFGQGWAVDDVAAHEFAHAVDQYTSNLTYQKQAGAIEESLCDMWGQFVDLANDHGDDNRWNRWEWGEDLPEYRNRRNMYNPPNHLQPDRISSHHYYCQTGDNCGVHTNSGVNNKAVSLMVDGGRFNFANISGIGLEKTARIYWNVQSNKRISRQSTFFDLFNALPAACNSLVGQYHITANDCAQVSSAVQAVEMWRIPCLPLQIRANGEEAFTYVRAGRYVRIDVEIDASTFLNNNAPDSSADYFFGALYNNVLYYMRSDGTWTTIPTPIYQGPIDTIHVNYLYYGPLQAAEVTYIIAVDLTQDGIPNNPMTYDWVVVREYDL